MKKRSKGEVTSNLGVVVKKFILFFLVCLFTIGSIFLYLEYSYYKKELNYQIEKIVNHEESLITSEKSRIEADLEEIISDIFYISKAFEIDYSIDDRENIEAKWCEFVKKKEIYDQIRFIDVRGQEKVRVNYNKDKEAEIVKQENLQNKAKKGYFKDSIGLDKDEIYISVLDLNMENGKIEMPVKPMLRFAVTVRDNKNNKIGVIILNYKAKYLLDKIKIHYNSSYGDLAIINENGYYLASENKDYEFAFMYPEKKDITYLKNDPSILKQINSSDGGKIIKDDRLINYSKISVKNIARFDKKYKYKLAENEWSFVSTINAEGIFKPIISSSAGIKISEFLKLKILTLIEIFIISILLSIVLTSRSINKDKITFYSEIDPLTNTYNRRAGYKYILSSYKKASSQGKDMSICFMDINGLKSINDTLGHEYGDEIIVSAANIIQSSIRANDIFIRLGGDEFLLAIYGQNVEQTEKIWQRIKNEFDKVNTDENRPYLISVSHGVVALDFDSEKELEHYIDIADESMYEEKRKIKENIKIIRD